MSVPRVSSMDMPWKYFNPSHREVIGQRMVLFPQDQIYLKRVNNLDKQVFVLQKWKQQSKKRTIKERGRKKGRKTDRKKTESAVIKIKQWK